MQLAAASSEWHTPLPWLNIPCCAGQPMQAPDEVVWLNGAPGSGKGANTPFICESRGISRAITMCVLQLGLVFCAVVVLGAMYMNLSDA